MCVCVCARACRRRVLLSLRSYQRTYFALSEHLACHANPTPGNTLSLSRDTWRLPPPPWYMVEAGNSFLPGLSCVTSVHAPPLGLIGRSAPCGPFGGFSRPSPRLHRWKGEPTSRAQGHRRHPLHSVLLVSWTASCLCVFLQKIGFGF